MSPELGSSEISEIGRHSLTYHFLDIHLWMQLRILDSISTRELDWSREEFLVLQGCHYRIYKNIEKKLGISRSGGAFWMELNTEVRLARVSNTLVTAIVGIDEKFRPLRGQSFRVHSKTVVLGCDITSPIHHACAGNVVSSISELHLQCACTCSSGQELMSQANTKDWCPVLSHSRFDVLYCLLHHGRVTGTIGDEEPIVVLACKGWEIIVPGTD